MRPSLLPLLLRPPPTSYPPDLHPLGPSSLIVLPHFFIYSSNSSGTPDRSSLVRSFPALPSRLPSSPLTQSSAHRSNLPATPSFRSLLHLSHHSVTVGLPGTHSIQLHHAYDYQQYTYNPNLLAASSCRPRSSFRLSPRQDPHLTLPRTIPPMARCKDGRPFTRRLQEKGSRQQLQPPERLLCSRSVPSVQLMSDGSRRLPVPPSFKFECRVSVISCPREGSQPILGSSQRVNYDSFMRC